jgi:hypothetical protein
MLNNGGWRNEKRKGHPWKKLNWEKLRRVEYECKMASLVSRRKVGYAVKI